MCTNIRIFNKGFSLFEIVIVMALLSIILPSLYQIISLSQRVVSRARLQIEVFEEGIHKSHLLQKDRDTYSNEFGAVCVVENMPLGDTKTLCGITVQNQAFSIAIYER